MTPPQTMHAYLAEKRYTVQGLDANGHVIQESEAMLREDAAMAFGVFCWLWDDLVATVRIVDLEKEGQDGYHGEA